MHRGAAASPPSGKRNPPAGTEGVNPDPSAIREIPNEKNSPQDALRRPGGELNPGCTRPDLSGKGPQPPPAAQNVSGGRSSGSNQRPKPHFSPPMRGESHKLAHDADAQLSEESVCMHSCKESHSSSISTSDQQSSGCCVTRINIPQSMPSSKKSSNTSSSLVDPQFPSKTPLAKCCVIKEQRPTPASVEHLNAKGRSAAGREKNGPKA